MKKPLLSHIYNILAIIFFACSIVYAVKYFNAINLIQFGVLSAYLLFAGLVSLGSAQLFHIIAKIENNTRIKGEEVSIKLDQILDQIKIFHAPPKSPEQEEYYVLNEFTPTGPVPLYKVRDMLENNEIEKQTLIRSRGGEKWIKCEEALKSSCPSMPKG